jgi:hypothetical protein
MNKHELEYELDKVYDWIKAVDQKASIALALEVGITTIFTVPTVKLIIRLYPNIETGQLLLATITPILFAFAIYKSLWVIKPRIKMQKEMNSLIFFHSIAHMTFEDFKEQVRRSTPTKYKNDLIHQIYESARVAKNKHVLLTESVYVFILACFSWLILVLWVGYSLLIR